MSRFISDETRRRLATGWDPRVSTLREYARQTGVSERAIRNWRARLRHDGSTTEPAGSDTEPLLAAMDALQGRLEELEAAVDAARAAVAATHDVLAAVAAHGEVEADANAPGAEMPQRAPVERKPMPPPGCLWM